MIREEFPHEMSRLEMSAERSSFAPDRGADGHTRDSERQPIAVNVWPRWQADRGRDLYCRRRCRPFKHRSRSPCPAIPRETPNPASLWPKPAETIVSPRSSIAVAARRYRLPHNPETHDCVAALCRLRRCAGQYPVSGLDSRDIPSAEILKNLTRQTADRLIWY
jgi:hypothetical protein